MRNMTYHLWTKDDSAPLAAWPAEQTDEADIRAYLRHAIEIWGAAVVDLWALEKDDQVIAEGPDLVAYAFPVVIERAASNYAAYVSELPGCVATGDTLAEVEQHIREAIAFHLDGMSEDANARTS